MRVLVIEDHGSLARAVATAMREAGYATDVAGDGEEALALLAAAPYDVAILDLMLPKRDGFSVLRSLRASGAATAVLVLTAKTAVQDRVVGLDAGADDYLTKPFALDELLARVRALMRRRHEYADTEILVGALVLDTVARRVSVAGEPARLTAREYSVLEALVLNRGRVLSRAQLFEKIYDFTAQAGPNVIEAHISNLRRKLGAAGELLRTRRGFGYTIEGDEDA